MSEPKPKRLMQEDLLLPLADKLSVDDMPTQELRWIAERLGVRVAVSLAVCFEGLQLYIRKSVKDDLKRLYCRLNYDGHNAKRLALDMGVAEPTVYKWIAASRPADATQTHLFEDR